MRNRLGILTVMACLGLSVLFLGLWARERQASMKFSQENLGLEKQLQERSAEVQALQGIKTENQRLASVKIASEELEKLRQEHNELLRLRAETSRLRETQAAERSRSTPPTPRPVSSTSGTIRSRSPFESTIERLGGNPFENLPNPSIDPQREPAFQQHLASPRNQINWSPGQASGAPDTQGAGDLSTAWAPQSQDGGPEWLKLEYEQPVEVSQIRIRETYNPGTVSAITAILENGSEVTLWQGDEPKSEAPVEMEFNVPNGIIAKRVTVHLDTARVAGWNEIDAVELIGRDGSRQWAKSASASSYYGEGRPRNYDLLNTPGGKP